MKLEHIIKIAREVEEVLEPYCKRIAIAGSIRREKSDCKDIEIVCIPFQSGVPLAKYFLQEKTIFKKNGRKWKKFNYGGVSVDLFITDERHWGLTYLVRTGSEIFNKTVCVGLLSCGHKMDKGKIVTPFNKDFPIPEEKYLFDLIHMPFVEPINRV